MAISEYEEMTSELKENLPEKKEEVTPFQEYVIKEKSIPSFYNRYIDFKKYETLHDIPCPPGFGTEVAGDSKINEYVLNHLPLTEEQKKLLTKGLMKDEQVKQRGLKVQEVLDNEIHLKKGEKSLQKMWYLGDREHYVGKRQGVKEGINPKSTDERL